jgi:TRAP-type C4-dicarboxylate transport system substrate-binding protein
VPGDKLAQSVKSPGGVQGIYSIPMYVYATKMYESLRYVLDVPICPVFSAFVLSNDAWAAIPAKYKPLLLEKLRDTERNFVAVQKNNDAEYLGLLEQGGARLVKLSPDQRAYWEKVLTEDARRMAEAGDSIIDRAFQERLFDALGKYRAAHAS